MIVLDTRAWLWWLHDPAMLSARARREIRSAVSLGQVRVSAMSVWEVALKASQGRLDLGTDVKAWFREAREEQGIEMEPVLPEDGIAANELPAPFHRDPVDRLIVALAHRLSARLVTLDRKILAYPYVETIS